MIFSKITMPILAWRNQSKEKVKTNLSTWAAMHFLMLKNNFIWQKIYFRIFFLFFWTFWFSRKPSCQIWKIQSKSESSIEKTRLCEFLLHRSSALVCIEKQCWTLKSIFLKILSNVASLLVFLENTAKSEAKGLNWE